MDVKSCVDINPAEIGKLICGHSAVGFKETFELKMGDSFSQSLILAAGEALGKGPQGVFDRPTARRFEELKPILQGIADGKNPQDIMKELIDSGVDAKVAKDQIFGKDGALNFALAISRVADVFCNLTYRDVGKVSMLNDKKVGMVVRATAAEEGDWHREFSQDETIAAHHDILLDHQNRLQSLETDVEAAKQVIKVLQDADDNQNDKINALSARVDECEKSISLAKKRFEDADEKQAAIEKAEKQAGEMMKQFDDFMTEYKKN